MLFRSAKFHQPGVDSALQQKLCVLVDAVVVHAATGMPGVLVAQVQLVVFRHEAKLEDAWLERPVASCCSSLAAIRPELLDRNAERHAGLTAIAIGTIRKHAAPAKPVGHQIGVRIVVNQVTWRSDLRTRLLARQVAAGVGRRCVELQGLQGQIFKVRHDGEGVRLTSSAFQYRGLNSQVGDGKLRLLVTCARKKSRLISDAPSDAR